MYIYTITSLKKYDIGSGLKRLVYVGSCVEYEVRFRIHKSDCFNEKSCKYNSKVYKIMREYGFENFVFEVIEVMSDDTDKTAVKIREQFYIDKFEAKKSMNTNDVVVDKIEYRKKHYADNAERIKEKRKEYIQQNREKCNQKMKELYAMNRETISKQRAERRSKNRDRMNALQNNRRLMRQTFSQFCNITLYED